MPCHDPDPYRPSHSHSVETVNPALRQAIDNLTRMLCAVMTHVETVPALHKEIEQGFPGIKEWWRNHKAFDKERIRQENARIQQQKDRKAALAKLTAKERRALGL